MTRYSSMEKQLSSQFSYWKSQKNKVVAHDPHKDRSATKNRFPVITLSREYGCLGYTIAEAATKILNKNNKNHHPWAAYDRELLGKVMRDMGLSESLADTMTTKSKRTMTDLFQSYFDKLPPQVAVYRKLAETVRILAENGNVVLVGRASNLITRDMPLSLHVRIVASMEFKINQIAAINNISKKEAEKLIINKTKERDQFIKEYVKFDLTDPINYDLIINNSTHSTEEAAHLVVETLKIKNLLHD